MEGTPMYPDEWRRRERLAWRGVPERLGVSFSQGNIEMRAKPNGTPAGTNFEFSGYAAVYDVEFDMWDRYGEPYKEHVEHGASKRSLGNPNLDVPFLIGHNDAGIPLARTKSGTMRLSEDSHGTHAFVPSMDGRREEVRALASAVERGDMDEMSLAFVCTRQEWDPSFERRAILEWDLHRGDVCAVVHGANSATAGASMFPVEQLSGRRPPALGGPAPLERRAVADMHNGHARIDPDGDGDCDACPEGDTDHDFWDTAGNQLQPLYDEMAAGRPYELRAQMSTASINDLPDSAFAYIEPGGTKDAEGKTTPRSLRHFPVHDAAHTRNALARAPQSPFGDKAMPKIRAAAKKFGVAVSDQHAARRLLELLASAIEDMDLATASDYDAAAADHPYDGEHTHDHPDYAGGTHSHAHNHAGDASHSHGHSATITVDGGTGIPGPEVQMSAARKLEIMARELELEELASGAVISAVRA